ncbi:MAG TPA: SGNH/GDSL hydrolase family protein [Armatimonadota bacterium]|jgi:lysophospholipase L1-like esterase
MSELRKPERLLAKLRAGEHVVIVALGDSNTELNFHTRGALNWVGLLQAALFDRYGPNHAMVINAAQSGQGITRSGSSEPMRVAEPAGQPASSVWDRLDRDVLRFTPDLVIVGYLLAEIEPLRELVRHLLASGPEVVLRTGSPIVATNQPPVFDPPLVINREWPGQKSAESAAQIVALAEELQLPVVDHYTLWTTMDNTHTGAPGADPNKLWMRMSDAIHPGPAGHLAFYRELAPVFDLPAYLPWEV